MRFATVALLLVVGCRQAAPPRAPVADCRSERVGRVRISGGTTADVPQLAVLEGTLDDAARTERVRLMAIDTLRTRGYPRAWVGVTRRPRGIDGAGAVGEGPSRASCGVDLDVTVVPGRRFEISAIEIVANDEFPAGARAAAIEEGLGTINAVGGAYVEDRLVTALADLQRRYRAGGWIDAVIDPPVARFDEARGRVRVTITIRAGKRT